MAHVSEHRATNSPGASQPRSTLSEEIARRAYMRAERRGFEPGHELEDWLAAEQEMAERKGAGAIG